MTHPDRVQDFLRLLSRHESGLHGFVHAMLANWSDAEDVLQETHLLLWQKFDTFEPGTNFHAWACRIAYLETLRFRRNADRKHLKFSDDFLKVVADETIEMEQELAERRQMLAECIERLKPADRDLLKLRYTPDQTTPSIAAAVGSSVDAVYKSLSRIRAALAACVQRKLAGGGS
ncbi:MAG: sigma-70 family RNA polymerase sigma factor [Planctomycetes bacterium]|nr:sigma-70 family RNA polymerase sigma factor [Planctomycetota bacterium]